MKHYTLTPWRLKFSSRDGWEVWTKRDKAIGSRNNYVVATGIQNQDEGMLLAVAPEMAALLERILCTAERGLTEHENCGVSPKLLKQARTILARLEGDK